MRRAKSLRMCDVIFWGRHGCTRLYFSTSFQLVTAAERRRFANVPPISVFGWAVGEESKSRDQPPSSRRPQRVLGKRRPRCEGGGWLYVSCRFLDMNERLSNRSRHCDEEDTSKRKNCPPIVIPAEAGIQEKQSLIDSAARSAFFFRWSPLAMRAYCRNWR